MTTPRFLVSSEILAGQLAVIRGSELHHLRVRRVRIGGSVVLSDGRGHQRRGIVLALERAQAVVRFTPDQPAQRESPLHLVLAQALLKADKMDLVVEKATELGADEVVVFSSERSLGQASADRQARWERIARSAAKQCQRSMVPVVSRPLSFGDLLSRREGMRLLFSECAKAEALTSEPAHAAPPALLAAVGPEGGFAPTEVERAAASGFRLASLGPRILRAETAAVVAVSLCQFLWGDLYCGNR